MIISHLSMLPMLYFFLYSLSGQLTGKKIKITTKTKAKKNIQGFKKTHFLLKQYPALSFNVLFPTDRRKWFAGGKESKMTILERKTDSHSLPLSPLIIDIRNDPVQRYILKGKRKDGDSES